MVVPFIGMNIWSIIICVGIGHLFDVIYPNYPYFYQLFEKKLGDVLIYQRISEEFIFLYVYSIMFLNLDTNRAFTILKKEVSISNYSLRNVEDVYRYYAENYLIKNGMKASFLSKRLTYSMEVLNFSRLDRKLFFRLIETVFDKLILNPNNEDIEKLKKIASILEINYVRNENDEDIYVYQNTKGRAYQQFNDKEKQGSKFEYDSNNIRGLLTDEIILAFKELGISKYQISSTTLIDAKKSYKNLVKKCHPDFMNGNVFSDREKVKAEKKLAKLNSSIEIVKKYLANT